MQKTVKQVVEEVNLIFQPMTDHILVLPDPAKTMQHGLIIPDSAQKNPPQGLVMAVGQGSEIHASYDVMVVQKQDKVMYGAFTGTPIVLEGVSYLLMRQADILGRLIRKEDGTYASAEIPKFTAAGKDGKVDITKIHNEVYNANAAGPVLSLEDTASRSTDSGIITSSN